MRQQIFLTAGCCSCCVCTWETKSVVIIRQVQCIAVCSRLKLTTLHRVGRAWLGCAYTLDSSGKTGTNLSLATFRQCSPLWPDLFWSGFFWQRELVQPRPSAEHCIWAQTECSAVCYLWSFFLFFEMLRAQQIVVFGSHNFFVAASHRPTATCHCCFLASFFKGNLWNENSHSFVSFSQQPTAAHSLCMVHFRFVTELCGSVVLWYHGGHVTETQDFQLQTMQLVEALCLFSVKSVLLCTSGKCSCVKQTAWMLNFIYIAQCKWYLWL